MGHTWIIDVLDDLATFARQNNMPVLTEKLRDTTLAAIAEMNETSGEAPIRATANGTGSRGISRQSRAC